MTSSKKWTGILFSLLVGAVAAVPALAGSAVIGSVAGSVNATVGGQAALPNTTIVSGDSLEVNDGAAVVAMDDSNRMVFSRQTAASFLRDSSEVTVLLSRGSVSLYHPRDGAALRIKIGEVTVEPVGVPKSSICLLDDSARNTVEEVLSVARKLKQTGAARVILVTSKPHTRRVKATWRALAGDALQAEVRSAADDPYRAERWWQNTEDALAVSRECFGLLNVWTGFPVQPDRAP